MAVLLDDRTDEEYKQDFDAWYRSHGWWYDLAGMVVIVLFVLALLVIGGMFQG